MLNPAHSDTSAFHFDPASRGFHVVYRCGEVNHCPGCGRTHWYVGRLSAECGFCGSALPLVEAPKWRSPDPGRKHLERGGPNLCCK